VTLIKLTIGHGCTGCRKCEEYLPGIKREVAEHGYWLANPINPCCDLEALADAMLHCETGAIQIDTV